MPNKKEGEKKTLREIEIEAQNNRSMYFAEKLVLLLKESKRGLGILTNQQIAQAIKYGLHESDVRNIKELL